MRAGAISNSDAVAIDVISFSGMGEGEMAGAGLGLRRIAFRDRDDGGANRRRLQPPAVIQQPPWQLRSRELNRDDLCHGLTMPGRLAGRLSGMLRICGFLCRFRAGPAGPPNRTALHEIMIIDEY